MSILLYNINDRVLRNINRKHETGGRCHLNHRITLVYIYYVFHLGVRVYVYVFTKDIYIYIYIYIYVN